MMKLLIIDDSPDALEVAKTRLAKENLDIYCAEGGREGLELARREKPDLILLDLEMPDMSGFEVCHVLKTDHELCMIPVLFLSGSATAEDKVHGLDLGAVDYVTKPFDAFELSARVRAALRTKHLQDLLIEHAHIDPLTGLPNRRALMERLQREWARIERHGGRLAFIMADIDHFKQVNDRYGHHIGDKLLQEVAHAIARQCREIDLPARCGGEEFAIIVPSEMTSGAANLAERCRQEVAKVRVNVGKETVSATASFGVAESTGLSSAETMVKRADDALYRAKNAGRNAVRSCENDAAMSPGVGLTSADATTIDCPTSVG
jgi:two-component system, cell cycle response regulator